MKLNSLILICFSFCGFCYGAFPGQSDNEDDRINRLLTYPEFDDAILEYPNPRYSTRFTIGYGEEIDPRFLVVELDGKDITHLFNPKPISLETISLPIVQGESKQLTLRIPERPDDSGTTPMWDYDVFEIRAEHGGSLMMFPGDMDPADMTPESAIHVTPVKGLRDTDSCVP